MKHLKVIAFTHKHIDLKDLGELIIGHETLKSRLSSIRTKFAIPEIFYVGTCNRVAFIFYSSQQLTQTFIKDFLSTLNFCVAAHKLDNYSDCVSAYEGFEALNHLLRMSCSLESMIVGEKEILSQIRRAYEACRESGFTGDYLRLIMDRVVKTAKEVYTYTNIAKRPISVVSLAYRKLRDLKIHSEARILLVGAGEINRNISKYLQKHTYSNFSIFNRTLFKAQEMAKELRGEAHHLDELKTYRKGFDVIITCTSSTEPLITNNIYQSLLNGEQDKKVIVDLAIPNDVCKDVIANNPIHYIEVRSLQEIANQNLMERYEELIHAERIIEENMKEFIPQLKQRRLELAMQKVPEKIKEIRKLALDVVFAQEIQTLDHSSREVLEKVVKYMEKKCISVPMLLAKEIIINELEQQKPS